MGDSVLDKLVGSVARQVKVNGVEAKVLPMTPEEMVVADGIAGEDIAANMGKVVDIISGCLCDESGNKSDDPPEERRKKLRRLGPVVLSQLFQECCQATGITEQAQDDVAKN